jgi:PAS domain S-box-containing protein
MNYLESELVEQVKSDNLIYNFINNSVLDGTWYWDLENPENEWMSPNFWSTLGYDPAEMPHKSNAWQNIIHPDDFILAKENLIKHFENTEYPYDQVVRYIHKNGSTVWIRCKGICIRNEQGKPIRMLGVHTKVSALILNQIKEVQENPKNDRASVLSSVLNGKHSDQQQKLKNRSLVQSNLENQESDENENYLLNKGNSFKELSEETKSLVTKEVFGDKMDKYPAELVGFLFLDRENEPRIGSFISDVSERIDLKELLKKRDELLSMLAEKTSDSLLIFNDKFELTYASPSFERIIGRTFEKFPIDAKTLDYIHPNDAKFVFESYFNAAMNNNKDLVVQYRALHASKGEIWLEDHANFEYDDNQQFKKAFIISRDITQRKLLELKFQEESDKRKQIAELLIESKEKSKEELYKDLHDGVNQLLFASKLSLENSGVKDNKNISVALDYLSTAIEEIRKIALESTSQFIFNDSFVSALTDYFMKINFTSELKFSVDTSIVEPIFINETIRKHIFRICQELAQNAIKHSKGTKMSFRFCHKDGYLTLIAKDNGIGLKNAKEDGIGIKSIKDRVYLMNGNVRFFHHPFQGMAVYIEVKLV